MKKLVYVNTNMGVFYNYLHDYSHIIEEYEVIIDDDSYVVIEDRGQNRKEKEKILLQLSNKALKTIQKSVSKE